MFDDFRPRASWDNLRLRAKLMRKLREFFDSRDFLEVETPILSADTVVDRNLDPFWVAGDHCDGTRRWLQTSPEFAMKRLMADGAKAIYQVARAIRGGEFGALHNPEFTIVEWYRSGHGMNEGIGLLSKLTDVLLGCGTSVRLSYREAFDEHVGLDPHRAETQELVAVARASKIDVPASLNVTDRDGWLELLLVNLVEPYLGVECPTVLYGYPASQAALAQVNCGQCAVAERFELYIDGIELANGYHELLDPGELRRRNAENNAMRRADGKSSLPEDSRLLRAMESGLPDMTGVAMGFDRVAMLAAGATRVADIMAFPFDRA